MAEKYIVGSENGPVAFDADLVDTNLEPNVYTDDLILALFALQNGAIAPAISDLLAPWNPIVVSRAGKPIISARAEAILAWNVLGWGKNPLTLISVADNDNLFLSGLKIPQWVTPGSDSYQVKATRIAPAATLDTLRHTVVQRYSLVRPANRPVSFKFIENSFTPAATGAWQNVVDYANEGAIVGVLVFSTTIGIVGSLNTSCRAMRLTKDSMKPINFDWYASGIDGHYVPLFASPGNISILDNYRYFDLTKSPIPPRTTPKVEIFPNTADAIRFYFVEQITGR